MSGKFKNKNVLFYRANDSLSEQFKAELDKNPPLKRQFILINQDDPSICIPQVIAQMKESLILIANGVNSPITGKNALFWIANSGFANKGNGLDYMNLGKENLGASLDDSPDQIGNTKYSMLNAPMDKIDTYEDTGRNGNKSQLAKRADQFKMERNQDLKMWRGGPEAGTGPSR